MRNQVDRASPDLYTFQSGKQAMVSKVMKQMEFQGSPEQHQRNSRVDRGQQCIPAKSQQHRNTDNLILVWLRIQSEH